MTFTTPLALLLLLLIPVIVWIGWQPPERGGDRWGRPRSGWASLLLRLFIFVLLVGGLAGAQWVQAVDDLAVLFLVDDSDSMTPDQAAAAEQFVREAVATMDPDDRAGVVLFGSNALVEQPVRSFAAASDLPPFASQTQRLNTDLAEALRLGLGLLPSGAARRMVVLSDGAATTGDAAAAADLAAASGVVVDTVLLPRPTAGSEVVLEQVRAPARVGPGETFRLQVAATSTVATDAILRVLGGGAVLAEETVTLQPGGNNFVVRLTAADPEFSRYRVQLVPAAGTDTFPQNNELAAFTQAADTPRILLVAGESDAPDAPPDEAAQLRLALEAGGLQVTEATVADLPPTVGQLAGFAGVVLANVNARDLSPRQLETLESYVRDLGGGLVVVGGPDSYGMGGYFDTPLEDALPVSMQIEDDERFPSVSLALVLDRSGSMAVNEGGLAKIQLATEGAVRAAQLLNEGDEMTVIPVDTVAADIVGPFAAEDRADNIGAIRQIGAGGGGIFMRTGLEAAAETLSASDKQVKHIIVLADGADAEEKEGVPDLIRELGEQGITVSMVSIGDGPDTQWLQQMAEIGNGRFHFTNRAANLPQIFTQETAAIQRSYLVEERFFPEQLVESEIMSGIEETPPLYGYVATSPKRTAEVILETPQGDPLLATWQYGLGRSAAWTSDATGRWAVDWVEWPGFATFWTQLLRATSGRDSGRVLEGVVTYNDETATLTVDAIDESGAFLNDLNLIATVVDPAGKATALALDPVAPGQYRASFTPSTEGAYFIGVGSPEEGGGERVGTTTGWVLGYSPEYRDLSSNPTLLASLTDVTGGRILAPVGGEGPGPDAVFARDLAAAPASQPLWPWLVLAAVLLVAGRYCPASSIGQPARRRARPGHVGRALAARARRRAGPQRVDVPALPGQGARRPAAPGGGRATVQLAARRASGPYRGRAEGALDRTA